MDHPISTRRQDLVLINKKKACNQVDFDITVYHWVKMKENETKDK